MQSLSAWKREIVKIFLNASPLSGKTGTTKTLKRAVSEEFFAAFIEATHTSSPTERSHRSSPAWQSWSGSFPLAELTNFQIIIPILINIFFCCYFVLLCRYLTIRLTVCRCTPQYADNYEWFVELAKNFHSVQTQMVSILFIFTISLLHDFSIHLLKMGDSNSLI